MSMEFSRQGHYSGLSFPTTGDLPDPGMEPLSLGSPALARRFFITAPPGKPFIRCIMVSKVVLYLQLGILQRMKEPHSFINFILLKY